MKVEYCKEKVFYSRGIGHSGLWPPNRFLKKWRTKTPFAPGY